METQLAEVPIYAGFPYSRAVKVRAISGAATRRPHADDASLTAAQDGLALPQRVETFTNVPDPSPISFVTHPGRASA